MGQKPQQQPIDSGIFTSYRQWRDGITGLATLPARTVMLPLRKEMGYRQLTLGALVGTTCVLCGLNAIGNWHVSVPLLGNIGAAHQSESLRNYGLAFLGYGLWQRHRRWRDLLAGKLWHTRSRGVSYFEFLPIRQDLIYRNIDPAVSFLAGCVLRKVGFSRLGLWVIFSSVCWRLVEERVHEISLDRDLDVVDSLAESKVQAEAVAHFEGQGEVKARSLADTGGIPTGADAGLEAQIAKRRREAAEVRS
jgi:hypothetical protein